jgi:hypothetical protein
MRAAEPRPRRDGRSTGGAKGAGRLQVAWTWLRRVGLFAVTVAVFEYVVLPKLLSARGDLHLFLDASPLLLLLGVAFEVSSLLAYTALTRLVLQAHVRLRFADQLRIDLTGLGASHIVPGGGATAAALRHADWPVVAPKPSAPRPSDSRW